MTTPAIPAHDTHTRPVAVEARKLLALYAIVPLCLAFVALDLAVFQGRGRAFLPKTTEKLFLFTAVFNFPHIVASYIPFFDRAYVRAYGRALVIGSLVVVLLSVTALRVLGFSGLLAAFLVATNVHIFQQQNRHLAQQLRVNDWSLRAYGICTQLIGGLLMFAVVDRSPLALRLRPVTFVLATVIALPSLFFAFRLSRRAITPSGRHFLWATQALLFGLGVAYVLGYPLLAILMTRVTHDLSAFYFSTVHDTNRAAEGDSNGVYRSISILGIPPAIAGPALAISVAYLVQSWLAESLAVWIVLGLSGVHYYLEALVWRPGTLHSEHASIR